MINKQDLDENIAELENARNHSPQMCARLADLYTIRGNLFGELAIPTIPSSYSTAPPPEPQPLEHYGNSEFLITIQGKTPGSAWKVMDELMDTLHLVNPRFYDSVMQKMRNL